ncbi:MAG: glycoside hydrolase family 2 TIM barrel-domain containing protein [Phycisphaerae bacterium]|nr:glycoside hydrolase family 2 TIM barrel-domain containing protein [Phycisphaerae bacterium]
MTTVPRPEYPRPQFVRPDWLCLNGEWQFEIDAGDSGLERGLVDQPLAERIVVPFCPESALSGIGHTDFMAAVWYRREVDVPAGWAGRRVLLHFQAVDYDATVWVNGVEAARHRGGFTPFTVDLGVIAAGATRFTLVVRARDEHRQPKPLGKQSQRYENFGCHYTRTTGIWQTVWLEAIPADVRLERPRITPDVANSLFRLAQPIRGNRAGLRLRATLSDAAGEVCSAICSADSDFSPQIDLAIPADRRKLWAPGSPHLYDLGIALIDERDRVVDRAKSYAGLRSITIDGKAVTLNGKPVFQRLVLDQGFYPDGILTAPTDDALRRDIELAMAVGFNGARLHQKVFEERFLYHADRLGYLVWGEFPDWGCRVPAEGGGLQPDITYITQWLEALHRDFSHPSIVGWCGLNETWEPIRDGISTLDDATRAMFLAAKAMDPTRPVLDTSGYSHRVPETDIFDNHDYTQDPAEFAKRQGGLADGKPFYNGPAGGERFKPGVRADQQPWSIPYAGQPFFVSEFGGTWWSPDAKPGDPSWGYGDRPKTLDEFYDRFERLCGVLLDDPNMFGYCYTQLTDVYQEQNGIYLFDRRAKFDAGRLRKAQQRAAAIER